MPEQPSAAPGAGLSENLIARLRATSLDDADERSWLHLCHEAADALSERGEREGWVSEERIREIAEANAIDLFRLTDRTQIADRLETVIRQALSERGEREEVTEEMIQAACKVRRVGPDSPGGWREFNVATYKAMLAAAGGKEGK